MNSAQRKQAIADAQYTIWRGTASGVHTMGHCCRTGCKHAARGSGVCIWCATKDLGHAVGEEIADEYLTTIQKIRELEGRMK